MSKLRGKKQSVRLTERQQTASTRKGNIAPGSQNPHKGRSGITRTSTNAAKVRSQQAAR